MRNKLLRLTAYMGCVSSLIIFFTAGGIVPLQNAVAWISKEAQSAAVFFVQSISIAQIQDDYHNVQVTVPNEVSDSIPAKEKKVKILIVPGHQPDEGGTQFRNIYEREIVVDLADALAMLLRQNPRYDVMVSRTKYEWSSILQSYFDIYALEINAFRESQITQMQEHITEGSILREADQIYHPTTPSAASFKLYGINKWASDNKYNIILHLHLNDYSGRRANRVGKYDGFTIYIPDDQYSNAEASKAIGEAIAVRLNAYHATSTLPKEDKGVVEDQELIAIGSNNSVDGAALLIEYGYIYEPQFLKSSTRSVAVADYAYQTYLGLQDFFKDPILSTFGSISFPYDWSTVSMANGSSEPGVYALQSALHYLGYYPPSGENFSNCPISGVVGTCTHSAIVEYQNAHGLMATGTLGPQTRSALMYDLASP